MKKQLCIGGPKAGQMLDCLEAINIGYNQFNYAYHMSRTKHAIRQAEARGDIIPPSMVWLHDDLFKNSQATEQPNGLLTNDIG